MAGDIDDNIRNGERADAQPTPEELEEGREQAEEARVLIETIVEYGIENGLIDRVVIDKQYKRVTVQPTPIRGVADEFGKGDEYQTTLRRYSRTFVDPAIEKTAERHGVPVEESDE